MTFSVLLKHLINTVKCVPPLVGVRHCSTNTNILQHHSLTVPTFGGSLLVKSPYQVNIKPTNTMDYPNLDQAFIKGIEGGYKMQYTFL